MIAEELSKFVLLHSHVIDVVCFVQRAESGAGSVYQTFAAVRRRKFRTIERLAF